MKYKVDGWNNFCRVFEVPESYPRDYCFGGGYPVNFQMVDWFNPVPDVGLIAVTKEVWCKMGAPIEIKEITLDKLYESLLPFLLEKQYTEPGRRYLVLCDFGAAFTFGV